MPPNILRTLYSALILPHFQFFILNWGFKANRITKLQKRAIRVITNSKYNAHVEPLLKQLNLLKVSDIFHNSLLKLFYKYKSGNLPHYIMHIFSDATSTHDYNTRSHTILDHPTTHLFGSEKCVRYQLPRVIEKADPNILEKVNTHCYTGFCLYLRRISVQNYKSECSQWNCYTCQNRDWWYIFMHTLYLMIFDYDNYCMCPFLSCMYIRCPFSLSSFSLFSFSYYCLFDCPKW